jgi:hypothetical protein
MPTTHFSPFRKLSWKLMMATCTAASHFWKPKQMESQNFLAKRSNNNLLDLLSFCSEAKK